MANIDDRKDDLENTEPDSEHLQVLRHLAFIREKGTSLLTKPQSAIRGLQGEILVAIFSFLMGMDMTYVEEFRRLCFLQVSSFWREVGLSSVCWTCFTVCLDSFPEDIKDDPGEVYDAIGDILNMFWDRFALYEKRAKSPVDLRLVVSNDIDRSFWDLTNLEGPFEFMLEEHHFPLRTYEESGKAFRGCFIPSLRVPSKRKDMYSALTHLYICSDGTLLRASYVDNGVLFPNLLYFQIQESVYSTITPRLTAPKLLGIHVESFEVEEWSDTDVEDEYTSSSDERIILAWLRRIAPQKHLQELTLFGDEVDFTDNDHNHISHHGIKKLTIGTHYRNRAHIPTILRMFPRLSKLTLALPTLQGVSSLSKMPNCSTLRILSIMVLKPTTSKTFIPGAAIEFANLILSLPNLTELEVLAESEEITLGAHWPFKPLDHREKVGNPCKTPPKVFIELAAALKVKAGKHSRRLGLKHLRLNFVLVNASAVDNFSKLFGVDEGKFNCLVTTTNCRVLHKASRALPDMKEFSWSAFRTLVA